MPRLKRLKPHTPLPWERQPEESQQAWEAFLIFRDMTKTQEGRQGVVRSNRETARRVGKNRALMDRWASRHNWRARAAAMDADEDREHRAKLRGQALAAVTQHAQLAGAAVGAVGMPLRALTKPQILTDENGETLLNEDGEPMTRDRQYDLERMMTPALLLLMRSVAAVLPAVIQIRMDALGNPHEPLPDLPEWGVDPDDEIEVTTPDRMLDIIRAAEESGILDLAGASRDAELAAVAQADALIATDANGRSGHQ